MRINLVLVILLALSLTLAACGSAQSAATTSTTAGQDATAAADGAVPTQGELSPMATDMLGMFKLEGTELAVDKEQAAVLLPLWQAYRSLLNSDTAATAELEALKTQIDGTLTAQQHDAMEAMDLTVQDMFAMAEKLGVTQAPPSADGTETEGNRPSFANGAFPGDAAGGGAPPAVGGGGSGFGFRGGGEMPEGFDPSTMQVGTPQAGRAGMGRQGDHFSIMLLDPLIELLQERSAS